MNRTCPECFETMEPAGGDRFRCPCGHEKRIPTPAKRWIRTGIEPARWDLCEGTHPENDAMAVGSAGYIEEGGTLGYRWETYGNPHDYGEAPTLVHAKRSLTRSVNLAAHRAATSPVHVKRPRPAGRS
jgi:hypothetical protein